MDDPTASATHERAGIVDEPFQIVGIRRRTATIRELWMSRRVHTEAFLVESQRE